MIDNFLNGKSTIIKLIIRTFAEIILKSIYMKNFILSLSVLAVMILLSNCGGKDSKLFVEIPDSNFKGYLLENFDSNKDGRISLSEAKKVKEMDCSGRNIKELTGIEKFENLERLICSNNQLDELDVCYNKKISWLDCRNNGDELVVYFAMSSPLSNKNFQKQAGNMDPELAVKLGNPIDVNKCAFTEGKTNFMISFVH